MASLQNLSLCFVIFFFLIIGDSLPVTGDGRITQSRKNGANQDVITSVLSSSSTDNNIFTGLTQNGSNNAEDAQIGHYENGSRRIFKEPQNQKLRGARDDVMHLTTERQLQSLFNNPHPNDLRVEDIVILLIMIVIGIAVLSCLCNHFGIIRDLICVWICCEICLD